MKKVICGGLLSVCSLLAFCHFQSQSTSFRCAKEWGRGSLDSNQACRVVSASNGDPSQFKFDTKPWYPKQENFYLDVQLAGEGLLAGLQFKFLAKDKILFTYDVPLFKDPRFNILQKGLVTRLSFPLSSSKIISSEMDQAVDQVKVYIVSQTGQTVWLDVSKPTIVRKTNPKGLISLSFDDGYASHYQAAKIMHSFKMTGTAFVIPSAVDSPSYVSWGELKEMKSWGWDISSHHQTPVTEMAAGTLSQELQKIRSTIESNVGKDVGADFFAYPLGKHSKETVGEIRKKFQAGRLASGGTETLPVANEMRIRTFNVLNTTPAAKIVEMAQKAHNNGEWIVFMFHYFDQPDKGEMNYSLASFKEVVQGLHLKKLNVLPTSKALNLK